MPLEFVYDPFPVFLPFHHSRARERALLGAFGSGKTIAMCAESIKHGLNLPGSRNLITRKTGPALQDNTLNEFLNLLATPPDEDDSDEVDATLLDFCRVKRGGASGVERLWLPTHSEYIFRPLDKWTKVMGLNLASIAVDEAAEITAKEYRALLSRLRQKVPLAAARRRGVRWPKDSRLLQKMIVAANSEGHNWMWDLFINDPTPDRRLFKSTSFDNPTLFEEDGSFSPFLVSLLNNPPSWVARYVFCDVDTMEGQILEFHNQENTHDPFVPPSHWERGMGMDWGLRSPTAMGWWARDPETGRWFKYREWQTYDPTDTVQKQMARPWSVDRLVDKIRELEGSERIRWRATGPDTFRRHPTAEDRDTNTVANHFAERGIHFVPGSAGYAHRINALNHQLFTRNASVATNLTETVLSYQRYRWDDVDVARDQDAPERPHKKDDHLVDADQYFFTLFTGKPRPPKPEHVPTRDELIKRAIRNQVKRTHAKRNTRKGVIVSGDILL